VARLNVYAEQHDIAGLGVGEYSVITHEWEGVEKSADVGEGHSGVQAFRPGTDFGHGEW
jgi:hypothetical protein